MSDKIAVIGNGGWGTTLALVLLKKGYSVKLWGAFPDYIEFLKNKRENVKFLPGISLPENLEHTSSMEKTLSGVQFIVMAVPSQFMRSVAKKMKGLFQKDNVMISVAKGIESESHKMMSEVLNEELNPRFLAVLSGPSHAEEVAREIPSSVAVASYDEKVAQQVQKLFMTDRFRIYTNGDLLGVEVSGALKNVIAIAAGISDGLQYGDNTKSALLARGLAEMTRLGVAMGAKRETFYGLAGVGDLITTAFSPYGRNRKIGELLGQGMKLEDALKTTEMIAEGVKTSIAVLKLARKYAVEMPISEKVYQVLYENLPPLKAVQELMLREAKPEG